MQWTVKMLWRAQPNTLKAFLDKALSRARRWVGGGVGGGVARHLSFCVSLCRILLTHTEVTATASDTFWHLLLVAGFHDKHPRSSTTFTSDTNASPSSPLQTSGKPTIQLLTAADNSCKKEKKSRKSIFYHKGAANTCRCIVGVFSS